MTIMKFESGFTESMGHIHLIKYKTDLLLDLTVEMSLGSQEKIRSLQ